MPSVPHRQWLGGDLYVTVDGDHPRALQVDAGFAIPGWKPRPPVVPSRPAFPGTAVLWQERWLELIKAEKLDGRFVYRLEPWDDAQTVRAPVELSPTAAEQLTEAYRQKVQADKAAERAAWSILWIGLLPAEEQRRLELTHGINPAFGTAVTAGVLAAFSIGTLLLIFAKLQGMSMGSLTPFVEACIPLLPLFPYLFVESMVRLGSGLAGEPIGSFVVAGPYVVLQTLLGKRRVAARGSERALPPAPRAPVGSELQWLQATDKVQALRTGTDGRARLEIRSRLPKDHWSANVHGIYFRDRVYILEQREGLKPSAEAPETHRFVLEEAAEDALFQNMHQYDPQEVREVYKSRRRLMVGGRLQTFGALWGFVEPALQEALAQIYGFNMWRHTKQSIFLQCAFGAVTLYTALRRVLEGTAGGADLILFFGAVFLIWEGVLRASALSSGEIRGSALGKGLGALVRPALRWRAAPDWHYPDR